MPCRFATKVRRWNWPNCKSRPRPSMAPSSPVKDHALVSIWSCHFFAYHVVNLNMDNLVNLKT